MRMQAVFQNENSLVFGFSIGGQKEEVDVYKRQILLSVVIRVSV